MHGEALQTVCVCVRLSLVCVIYVALNKSSFGTSWCSIAGPLNPSGNVVRLRLRVRSRPATDGKKRSRRHNGETDPFFLITAGETETVLAYEVAFGQWYFKAGGPPLDSGGQGSRWFQARNPGLKFWL